MLTAAMVNRVTEGMSEKEIAGILEGRLEMLRMTAKSDEELDAVGGEVWKVFSRAKVDRLSVDDRADFERHLASTPVKGFKGSTLELFFSLLEGLTWQEARLFSELNNL